MKTQKKKFMVDVVGRQIYAQGNDWIQLDDGRKLYLDEIELEEENPLDELKEI